MAKCVSLKVETLSSWTFVQSDVINNVTKKKSFSVLDMWLSWSGTDAVGIPVAINGSTWQGLACIRHFHPNPFYTFWESNHVHHHLQVKTAKRVVLIGNKKHFLVLKTNKKIYTCMRELSISVQKKPSQGILRYLPFIEENMKNLVYYDRKNIKEIIINHKGTRVVKGGEDWHGLQTTNLKMV